MMTKYGLPIVTVCWADCDSGTPIFWSPSFLGERRCNVLQVGSVGPVISLYPRPVIIGDQSGMAFFFKCHSVRKRGPSCDQSETAEQIVALACWNQVENTVSKLNGFLSFVWRVVAVFLPCWNSEEPLCCVRGVFVIFVTVKVYFGGTVDFLVRYNFLLYNGLVFS